jgi:hypothetical protein
MDLQMRREQARDAERKRIAQEERAAKQREEAARQKAENERRIKDEAQRRNKVKPSEDQSAYNFSGKVQSGTIVSHNKGFKDDEMYEGGAEPSEGFQMQAPGERRQTYLDMDKEEA